MPAVLRVLRQDGRAPRVHRDGVPVPLHLRGRARGHRYMGCLQKVFAVEIDIDMFSRRSARARASAASRPCGSRSRRARSRSSAPTRARAARSPARIRASSTLPRAGPGGYRAFDLRAGLRSTRPSVRDRTTGFARPESLGDLDLPLSGPWPSGPGTSISTGRRGSAARPGKTRIPPSRARPRRGSRGGRRFAPSGTLESFRWRHARAPGPTVRAGVDASLIASAFARRGPRPADGRSRGRRRGGPPPAQQLAQLREAAADRPAGSGGVLQQQRTALARRQQLGLKRVPIIFSDLAGEARPLPVPGCTTTPPAPMPSPTRSAWASESRTCA